MRHALFRLLCAASVAFIILWFCFGCASAPKPTVANCIPDVVTQQCVGTNAEGHGYAVLFNDPGFDQYLCFPAAGIGQYFKDSCSSQK